jgi:ABC-2 type transport system permease protein
VSAQAQIADRRFQHYEGRRLGVGYSFLRLVLYSIGWVLGLKRSSRYKIAPNLALMSTYVPAAGFVIAVAVGGLGTPPPSYFYFYMFTLLAIYIFVALTMPELICPDRRHGTLRMYTTSNLNPAAYVVAKLVAAWSVLALVTVVPVIILLVTYSLLGDGPGSVVDWLKTLAQIVGAGLELAIFYGTIALAISSLTDRNSFASAGIILTFVLSGAALGILQGPLKAPAWVLLVNVNELPSELTRRIYQISNAGSEAAKVASWEVAAAAAAWVLLGLAVLAYRYRGEGRR